MALAAEVAERERVQALLDDQPSRVSGLLNRLSGLLNRLGLFGCAGTSILVAVLIALGVVGWSIYDHEVNDIRAGYVRGTDHRSATTSIICSTVNRATTCTPVHHPEHWTVTIARGDEDATWDIPESTYERLRREPGTWYCTPRCTPRECELVHGAHEPPRLRGEAS